MRIFPGSRGNGLKEDDQQRKTQYRQKRGRRAVEGDGEFLHPPWDLVPAHPQRSYRSPLCCLSSHQQACPPHQQEPSSDRRLLFHPQPVLLSPASHQCVSTGPQVWKGTRASWQITLTSMCSGKPDLHACSSASGCLSTDPTGPLNTSLCQTLSLCWGHSDEQTGKCSAPGEFAFC